MPDKKVQQDQCTPEVQQELRAAEKESMTTAKRFEHDEVMNDLRAKIDASRNNK